MSRRTVTRPEVRVGGFWLSTIVPQGWGGLHHQTRRNGAWEASWTIPATRTWRHPALVYGAPVEVYLGPILLFVGSLAEPDWDSGEFIAEGACRDGETAAALTSGLVASTAPNTVIDAARTRGVLSWTRVSNFGTTPVGETDGGVTTVQAVLDAWDEENNSTWAIENTLARGLIIRPSNELVPTWYVTPGSGVLGSASDERVDRVFVRYISTTNGRRATASYPASSPVGGVEKTADITDRGAMDATKATTIAQGIWKDSQGRSGWTNGLSLKGGQVTNPGGTEVDLALIKAGDTMRLLGVPDPRGVAHNLDVVIGDTDYDWEEDELQANPVGLAARDEETVLERIGNIAVDAMAKASGKSSLSFSDYVRQGRTNCAPTGSPPFVTVAVTFDSPMPSVPKVHLTPFTAANADMQATASNVTSSGFDLNFRRDTATATNVDWTAICLPA